MFMNELKTIRIIASSSKISLERRREKSDPEDKIGNGYYVIRQEDVLVNS